MVVFMLTCWSLLSSSWSPDGGVQASLGRRQLVWRLTCSVGDARARGSTEGSLYRKTDICGVGLKARKAECV